MIKIDPKGREVSDILDKYDMERFLFALQRFGIENIYDCYEVLDSIFRLKKGNKGLISSNMSYTELHDYILYTYGITFVMRRDKP